MGIGKTLSEILREKNIAVTDLARDINIAPTTIYSIIERDNMKIDISVLLRICKSLNVDIETFYQDYLDSERKEIADTLTNEERKMLKRYRALDQHGKNLVNTVLKMEYDRCQQK